MPAENHASAEPGIISNASGAAYGLVSMETSFTKACHGAQIAALTRRMGRSVEAPPTEVSTGQPASSIATARRPGGFRALLRRFRNRLERKFKKALLKAGVVDLLESTAREIRTLRFEVQEGRAELDRKLREALLEAGLVERLDSAEREIRTLRFEVQEGRTELARHFNALVPVRTAFGYVAVPNTDIPLLSYLMSTLDPEAGTCRVLQSLIRPDDHVIDVGANVGVLTLAMARMLGTEGDLLAIEPSPELQEALRQTAVANGLASKIRIEAVAAADGEGRAELFTGGTSGWSSLTRIPGMSGGAVEVPLRTLDSLVEPGRSIALAKIDVEGSELLVLRGMTRILAESPNIALVVEFGPTHILRSGGTVEGWLRAFREQGLDAIFEIDEATGACTPARSDEELASVVSVNLLITQSGSDALLRLGLA
jgi:FkbM family methyltransferase